MNEDVKPKTFDEFLKLFLKTLEENWRHHTDGQMGWYDLLTAVLSNGNIISNLNYAWEHRNVNAQQMAGQAIERLCPKMKTVQVYCLYRHEVDHSTGSFTLLTLDVPEKEEHNWEFIKKKATDSLKWSNKEYFVGFFPATCRNFTL